MILNGVKISIIALKIVKIVLWFLNFLFRNLKGYS